MMPPEVRSWVEGASWARYRRDVAQAKADKLSLPLDKRDDWFHARKHELKFQHAERMADAEKRWPRAMTEAQDDFRNRLCAEFNGRERRGRC